MGKGRLEIIELSDNRDGWRQARLALDGILACPIDISEERFRHFADLGEYALLDYLRAQARVAISAFGDYRNIRRREDGEYLRLDEPTEGGNHNA